MKLVVHSSTPRRRARALSSTAISPERSAGAPIVRRALKITGRIESQTDEDLQPLYREWDRASPRIGATILAALGQIELHLSARAASADTAAAALDNAIAQVRGILGDDVFSVDGRAMEAVVGDLLAARGFTIGLAESCTGGLTMSRLTDVPGSSRYVDRGVVVYANAAKIDALGVPATLIDEYGAVSEPVALAMADGIRSRAAVDVGIGITGIAGPGGGSTEKPVGTVAIAVVSTVATRSRVFRFHGEREQVKFQASQAALDMVRRMLK